MDAIQQALDVGEVYWAISLAKAAIKAARGRALYKALRTHAEILTTHADDTDLPDLVRAAAAWTEVTRHALAAPKDFEALAWAELLAFKPKKAAAALGAVKKPAAATVRAVAWAQRRKDPKRLAALEAVARTCDETGLEGIVRLLVQADIPATEHADRLAVLREKRCDVWDPELARAIRLRVSAYRSVDERDRASAILAAWAKACGNALSKRDVRRHVLDMAEGGDEVGRAERRVERVSAHYGPASPALEQPLRLLAFTARHADQHAVAVAALQKLEPFRQSRIALYDLLVDLYQSLAELGRFDEAFAAIERYERVKAKTPLHLVPDHHARARVYEAMGDLDRMVEEHLAAVAQWEAAPPPIYGPKATNTELARGWARMAMERAGRHAEAKKRFPRSSA